MKPRAYGPLGDSTSRDRLATRRQGSLFGPDVADNQARISEQLRGRRILVVGGAGSIGSHTSRILATYAPAAMHVVDQNENTLVELVRDLRGRDDGIRDVDFQALPLDYGSPLMARLLRDADRYDLVLNFAALKHVRSEKDIYSALQMLDTNIVRHARFLRWLSEYGHGAAYFAVSTDKAADPSSLMGASKRLMEDLIFGRMTSPHHSTTSARFANVAFSDGSLLHGFLQRIDKRQPLAVPRDTRRYFISHQEAGELCLLAATVLPNRHVAVPRLDADTELQSLESIAIRFLEHLGLAPSVYDDERAAKDDLDRLASARRWPILLTPLDTSGEKAYEEFAGKDETTSECGLKAIVALKNAGADVSAVLERLEHWVNHPASLVDKRDVVDAMRSAVTNFQHLETDLSLDQRF